MSEMLPIVLAVFAGALAGLVFFGGLWLTVRRLPTTRRPGLWMIGGSLLRFAVALGIFYFVGRDHLDRLLACLGGFIVARVMVTRFTRSKASEENRSCT